MRKLFLTLSFALLATYVALAQGLSGIRISTNEEPVVVYLNGQQVSSPTQTCFIANLLAEQYSIRVYRVLWKYNSKGYSLGECIYNKRIYHNGIGITDIYPGGYSNNGRDRYHRYDRREDIYDKRPYGRYGMSQEEFERFYQKYKALSFDNERINLLEAVIPLSGLYTDQCLRLVQACTFDSEKIKIMEKLYPYVIDKENFYQVIEELTFSSDKEKMYKMMRRNN